MKHYHNAGFQDMNTFQLKYKEKVNGKYTSPNLQRNKQNSHCTKIENYFFNCKSTSKRNSLTVKT